MSFCTKFATKFSWRQFEFWVTAIELGQFVDPDLSIATVFNNYKGHNGSMTCLVYPELREKKRSRINFAALERALRTKKAGKGEVELDGEDVTESMIVVVDDKLVSSSKERPAKLPTSGSLYDQVTKK